MTARRRTPFGALGQRGVLIAAFLAVLFIGDVGSRFAVDVLWFSEVGALPVLWTRLRAQLACGAIGFVIAFALLGVVVFGTLRRGPALRIATGGGVRIVPMDQRLRPAALAAAAVVAFGFAVALGDHWLDFGLARSGGDYGVRDPWFGRDAGDYVFAMPALRAALDWLLGLLALTLAIGVAAEMALAAMSATRAVPVSARRRIAVLSAVLLATIGARLLVAQYGVVYSPHGAVHGAGWTDMHARLPAFRLLAVAAFAAAGVVAVAGWRGRMRWLLGAPAAWVVLAALGLGVVPSLVQKLIVEPNELEKETPYLEAAIAMTRYAYELDGVAAEQVQLAHDLDAADLGAHADVLQNVRLWDWQPLLATYGQIQEIRPYYDFHDVDIDRYRVDGMLRQVMMAAREIAYDEIPEGARTWVNVHLKYTHGYGLCASPVNRVTREGMPELWVRDIPPEARPELAVRRPEIYYGEQTTAFALVGMSTDEFDYPAGDVNAATRYSGRGGIAVGSFWRRLLFAAALRSRELLLTDYLTADSRILLHRSLSERVPRIAPFLRYDHDPYLVIDAGRLYWIQDAYTVSDRFPGARPTGRLNTLRNSVKVVVDAYDGTTTFYINDAQDPILRSYAAMFPTLFTPLERMPAGLRAHLRFPEDLFRIQTDVLSTYHMLDPQVFYNREDVWGVPLERVNNREVAIEPVYTMLRLAPGAPSEFVLMQPFTPRGKDNMIAWFVARCDEPQRGERRLALFPKQELIYGPRQVEARIDQDAAISQLLTLWSQRGSNVIRGNLLVVPLAGTLLYVEPLYLQADQGALPELKRVIVAHAERIALGVDLDDALVQLQGGMRPAAAGPLAIAAQPAGPAAGTDPRRRALELLQAAEAALQRGDWIEHGRSMQALRELLAGDGTSDQRP
jgi:uncharacterized membrane protein (UPF0182 family)